MWVGVGGWGAALILPCLLVSSSPAWAGEWEATPRHLLLFRLQSGLHDLVCEPTAHPNRECLSTRFMNYERALTDIVQKVLPYEQQGTKFIW